METGGGGRTGRGAVLPLDRAFPKCSSAAGLQTNGPSRDCCSCPLQGISFSNFHLYASETVISSL